MFSIRVTGQDGSTQTHPFEGSVLSIGRSEDNDIVLHGDAVSGHHCRLECNGPTCVLRELGSTNGTWMNNRRVGEVTPISERDRIYVGSYLIELVREASRPDIPRARAMTPSGPILRLPPADRAWRDTHARLERYANEWDRVGRPKRLLLKPDELRRATRWLDQTPQDRAAEISRLQREFIAASQRGAKARLIKSVAMAGVGVVALGSLVAAAVLLWDGDEAPEAQPEAMQTESPESDNGHEPSAGAVPILDQEVPVEGEAQAEKEEIEHQVIPFETLEDVARRYGVSTEDVVDWNLLNPAEPDIEGKTLLIKKPQKRPLPQQRIVYVVEPGENWTKLSERFDVPASKLQAYNPDVELKAGAELAIWIDPKPYKPREPRKPIPEFDVVKSSMSVGEPNDGRLENGVQLPQSDLYIRRAPYIMWGSSFTIANLQEAVAHFRQDVDYEGELILADISKRSGGHFPPHSSHQAGRDIDIWLPTLKGVYKTEYLDNGGERPRRPLLEEVDWYAVWGLVRALIQTEAVQYVFLDWRYQKYVYRAAKNMGATEEELDKWIQYPRPIGRSYAIFRHSPDHLSHIHVRFKCAPWETECRGDRAEP